LYTVVLIGWFWSTSIKCVFQFFYEDKSGFSFMLFLTVVVACWLFIQNSLSAENIFLSMCDVIVFLTFTSLNLVLLWHLFYLLCSSIVCNFSVIQISDTSFLLVIEKQPIKKLYPIYIVHSCFDWMILEYQWSNKDQATWIPLKTVFHTWYSSCCVTLVTNPVNDSPDTKPVKQNS
jgi:hypothetical protein